MRIAFLSLENPASQDAFSGSTFRLVGTLREQGVDVVTLGPAPYTPSLVQTVKQRLFQVFQRDYVTLHTARAYTAVAQHFASRLQGQKFDCVLSRATAPVAALETDLPVFIWHDATFRQLLGNFKGFRALPRECRTTAERFERRALQRSRGVFYTSQWAARSAQRDYQVPAGSVNVALIGANRESGWDEARARRVIAQKDFSECRLLFIGAEWHRKGGDRMLRLVRALGALDVPVHADMIGDWPPAWRVIPENVSCLGSLPHSDPTVAERITRLFERAHFLVLPTRADCSPVVVAEAASYAVPTVCTAVGGLPEMVRHGETGLVGDFDDDDGLARLALSVAAMFERQRWSEAALAAHRFGRHSLNWPTHVRSILGHITDSLSRKAA